MKIGMMLGFEDSIKTITTIAQEAERSGTHSLYTVDAGRSATITAAAVINATHRAKVGTYIVNAFAREPWMTALEARDLNEISGGRNSKQCRERWHNHLDPSVNKSEWTPEEDQEIWDRVQEMGTKWAQISEQYMPLRTDNDIKNRWNSIIRKSSHPSGRAWKPNEITLREEAPPPRRPRRPAGPLRPARSPCAHARRLRLGRCSPRRG